MVRSDMASNDDTDYRLSIRSAPLPDELLGSWLARLALLNAIESAFNFFVRFNCFLNPRSLHLYDMGDLNGSANHLERVAKMLGMSEADIRALSTYPYAECFRERPSESAFAYKRPTVRRQKFLRVCPVCLREDERRFGCSYFHRYHQLPVSYVCDKHGVDLHSVCPLCGRPVGTSQDFRVPTIRCDCGHDHTSVTHQRDTNDPWWRLAKFEAAAMIAPPGSLSGPNVAIAIKELKTLHSMSMRDALVQTFGEQGLALLQNPLANASEMVTPAKRLPGISQMAPPLVCALFVSFSLDFVAATRAGVNASPIIEAPRAIRDPSGWRAPRPRSVDEAKAQVLTALADGSVTRFGGARARLTYAYWLLCMEDPSWLSNALPEPKRPSRPLNIVPRISDDRATLIEGPAASVMRYQEARVRAFYRDYRWLASKMLTPPPPDHRSITPGQRPAPILHYSVMQARRTLLALVHAGVVRTRSQLRHKRRPLFWHFAIRDNQWICGRLLSRVDRGPIVVPTVSADRQLISDPTASGDLFLDALARARIRDADWLQNLSDRRKVADDTVAIQRLLDRLDKARQAQILTPGRNAGWSAKSVARILGVNIQNLYRLAGRSPEVRAMLARGP